MDTTVMPLYSGMLLYLPEASFERRAGRMKFDQVVKNGYPETLRFARVCTIPTPDGLRYGFMPPLNQLTDPPTLVKWALPPILGDLFKLWEAVWCYWTHNNTPYKMLPMELTPLFEADDMGDMLRFGFGYAGEELREQSGHLMSVARIPTELQKRIAAGDVRWLTRRTALSGEIKIVHFKIIDLKDPYKPLLGYYNSQADLSNNALLSLSASELRSRTQLVPKYMLSDPFFGGTGAESNTESGCKHTRTKRVFCGMGTCGSYITVCQDCGKEVIG
jgi:hypothetical protein